MKKYDSYKDSGVEWLGQLPVAWKLTRLKFASDIMPSGIDKKSKEDEPEVLLCNYVDVYKNEYITDSINFMKATASESQISRLSLYKDDVIATKDSEDPSDIGVPAFVKETLDGVVCGYHLTMLRATKNKLSGHYLFWCIKSNGNSQYFETEARGITRYAIGTSVFSNLNIPLPTIQEQIQIANFLDQKTNQIDSLISKKERLIKFLQEERTAIINQAVTKGLDHNVTMKDSGIEWLGEIPVHWEVKRLKYLISKKIDNRGKTPPFGEVGRPMLEVKQIIENRIYPSEKFDKYSRKEDLFGYLRDEVNEGDVLIATVGATAGKCCIVPSNSEFFIAQNVIGFRCNKETDSLFFYYMVESTYFKDSLLAINKSNTIDNLKVSVFINNECIVPPLEEQKRLAKLITEKNDLVNKGTKKLRKEIGLLKEYKTALISEVVTGKVDVRDAVLN